MDGTTSSRVSGSAGTRWPALLEALVASAIILAHNVALIIPNEVPILVVVALVSVWRRKCRWQALGIGRPASWLRTLLLAILTAATLQTLSMTVTQPLLSPYLHRSSHANPFQLAHGAVPLLKWLVIIWTFAAFGEEIGYRGYLLQRAADAGGGGRLAVFVALIWSSMLFGFGHWYQGSAGVIGCAFDGLLLGTAFVASRRNLWVVILAHGISDSFAVLATFFGLFT